MGLIGWLIGRLAMNDDIIRRAVTTTIEKTLHRAPSFKAKHSSYAQRIDAMVSTTYMSVYTLRLYANSCTEKRATIACSSERQTLYLVVGITTTEAGFQRGACRW